MRDISWPEGQWTHPPVWAREDAGGLLVEAAEGSDAWRVTSYGFIHDTAHGLLTAFPQDCAMEVDFVAEYTGQFDQAGIFIRQDPEHWVKAGLEYADDLLQVGAVVTWPVSDWSVAPVASWSGHDVTVRVSRSGDAVTIRARRDDDPWQFVRVLPVPPDAVLEAGPLVAAPSRAGLTVRFLGWRLTDPDTSLH